MSVASCRPSFRFYSVFYRYLTASNSKCTSATARPFIPKCQRHREDRIKWRRYASNSTAPFQKESIRPQNHYDLFPSSLPSGPPPHGSFYVDPSILRKEFLQLQARAHPDRHQGGEKAKAEAASARINDAYKTLLNPLARARYLLSLHGVELGEDESIAGTPLDMSSEENGGANVDAAFLMDVMEVREGIEAAGSREEIDEMKAENHKRTKACEDRLEDLFKAEDIEAARRETVKLGYWVNVGTALEGWERVGDGRVSEHD